MADVFVAYSSHDRPLARRLVQGLACAGVSVWWDVALAEGEDWMAATEREICAAGASLVVWSPHSLQSPWVLREADMAYRLGRLVPLRVAGLDPRQIPRPYTGLRTLSFEHALDGRGRPTQRLLAGLFLPARKAARGVTALTAPRATTRAP